MLRTPNLVLLASALTEACQDLYARRLAATLDVPVQSLAGRTPLADEAAYTAARAAWEGLDAETRPLIALSVLPAFAPFASQLGARRAVVLAHQPLAEASGLPEAEREWLAVAERQVLAFSPDLIASSEAAAEAIVREAAVPRGRITVIAPPTPALARVRGSGGPNVRILAKGALLGASAHEVLLTALAGLADLDWQLCIAGAAPDADYATSLMRLVGELGLVSRVRFAQPTADATEHEALWQATDLFALAATGPGYRMEVAAALKRGVPVAICGDPATAPEIPPEAGAIAPPGDHAQLAKVLRRLVFDGALRREMAEAAWRAGSALPQGEAAAARLAAALG
ncbi:MAG TPA: glycosyltransferase [Acetobacteraceae bacterium]|nr:glycosyltransferase [Acetobacteraceae bacterium]